jgi:hypothetical protein
LPRELLDATPDGIRLLRDGVLRVGDKVRITVVGIDAEDREEGAGDRASPQQRCPRHPRGRARTASPPCRRKAKKDAAAKAASDLAEAEVRHAEEAAMEEAIQRSLRDVVPAENTMPLDAALEWSRREW